MSILKVTGLTKQFRDIKAVDQLSFTVNEADVYGFLGQNGAGKSTTIRMLLTLIQPTAGDIEFFGMNLRSHRKEILQRVGAVIERPDLYKYLSGYENLLLFAKMNGVKANRARLMEQLELVGLSERAQSKVKTYSQGMKQRLGIAVALVHDPQIVILDEPTNGLDPQGIADMRNLILHLSRHMKKTVIVSSHLLSEIEQVATRMLIIDKGRKIIEDSVDSLFNPANSLIKVRVTNIDAALQFVQQSKWQQYFIKHEGETVVLQLPTNEVQQLNADFVLNHIGVLSLQPQHSLEEYFLSLTAGKQHVATFAN